MNNILSNCVGIDISKDNLDLHATIDNSDYRFPNSKAGAKKCLALCRKIEPQLVVLEATGGYENSVFNYLASNGIKTAIVNPDRVRHFAIAVGQLAKTDRIDARIIASFAQALQPEPQQPISEENATLKALTTRRRQLIELKTKESNHLEHVTEKIVKQSIKSVTDCLEKQINEIDEQINQIIDGLPLLKNKTKILETIPGVGKVTANAVVVSLPELGDCNRRQIAMLSGVAPVNKDSGASSGKRFTGRGRSEIRTILFMPVLVAIQHNKPLKKFYDNLVKEKHKTKMVAIVATMRKLVCIMNTMIAKNIPWNEALLSH